MYNVFHWTPCVWRIKCVCRFLKYVFLFRDATSVHCACSSIMALLQFASSRARSAMFNRYSSIHLCRQIQHRFNHWREPFRIMIFFFFLLFQKRYFFFNNEHEPWGRHVCTCVTGFLWWFASTLKWYWPKTVVCRLVPFVTWEMNSILHAPGTSLVFCFFFFFVLN